MSFEISQPIFDLIAAHAVETFPEECCGFVVERNGFVHVERITNVQNRKHAEDPQRFPRTAAIAYSMGPEAAPLLVDHDRGRLRLLAIYHSHPQHEAYFSAEDRKQATVWDEPSYPDAAQIVVSVFDGMVKGAKAFRWSEERRDFVEVELRVAEPT